MRGVLPSVIASALFVVPRSIPMTAPLTFSVLSGASVEAYRAKREDRGIDRDERTDGVLDDERREIVDARGA